MEHTTIAFVTSLINATDVGILPMIVNFTFFVAYISMGAAFVFFLAQRNNVAPEYRTALVLSALIVGIAAFHYFYMKTLYAETTLPLLAEDLAKGGANYLEITKKSFFGIINYRYMDWLITTPLLVAKIPLAVAAGRKVGGVITALIIADVFMIVTGFIGEQYVAVPSTHLLWGAISTIGYLGIVYIIFTTVRNMAKDAEPEEQWAYKVMAIFIVTGWGIYPIGYMIPAIFPQFDLNIVHIVYNIGDQVNKIAPGIVVYMAGRQLLERRSPAKEIAGAQPLPA
ncbi:MAG: rhodopsin [Acidobacteria bacterium]|jgi:bacteriorhodopsin|nr:MAG: rhodopsin [Acidobacteriota bacterium]GIU82679.1 MAG: xanthorhodopsin [Pyrinomonadaceae bacterium]